MNATRHYGRQPMFPLELSLVKPGLGALGFLALLLFPNLPLWNEIWSWFGANKDGMQSVYYASVSVGCLVRGSVWLNRYLLRTHRLTIRGWLVRGIRRPLDRLRDNWPAFAARTRQRLRLPWTK